MIYKLLNKIFGWDYVAWHNTADSDIARVRVTPMGQVYYWRYKCTKVADIITDPKKVLWLTCSSTKYFNNNG